MIPLIWHLVKLELTLTRFPVSDVVAVLAIKKATLTCSIACASTMLNCSVVAISSMLTCITVVVSVTLLKGSKVAV